MKKIMDSILKYLCMGIVCGIAGLVIAWCTIKDIIVDFKKDYKRFGPKMFFDKRYWYCHGFF